VLEFLVLKIRDLTNPDLPMALSLSEFFRAPGFTPHVRERWTVLIQPRDIGVCDAPNYCQLETLNVDTLTVASMSTTCPVKMDG
jgi:hypothetical protein